MCWCKYIWKHICNTIVHCTVNSRTTERYTPAFSLLLLTIYRVFFFRALEFLRALAVKPTVKVNPGVWHLFSVYFAIFSCKNLLTCSLKIYAQDSSSVLQSYLPHFYRLNIFSDEAQFEVWEQSWKTLQAVLHTENAFYWSILFWKLKMVLTLKTKISVAGKWFATPWFPISILIVYICGKQFQQTKYYPFLSFFYIFISVKTFTPLKKPLI